jgi:hypothetical protein
VSARQRACLQRPGADIAGLEEVSMPSPSVGSGAAGTATGLPR